MNILLAASDKLFGDALVRFCAKHIWESSRFAAALGNSDYSSWLICVRPKMSLTVSHKGV